MVVAFAVEGVVAGDRTYYAFEQMRLRPTADGMANTPLKRMYATPVTAVVSISYEL